MKQELHHEHFPRQNVFRSVLKSLIWPLITLVWISVMSLLAWWQAPLFIVLSIYFLGMSLVAFMLVQYVRANMIPRKDERGSQAQGPEALVEASSDPQPFPSSSAWDNELFQVPYPEQE